VTAIPPAETIEIIGVGLLMVIAVLLWRLFDLANRILFVLGGVLNQLDVIRPHVENIDQRGAHQARDHRWSDDGN